MSKGELKKRQKKRAAKAAKEAVTKQPKTPATAAADTSKAALKPKEKAEEIAVDPEHMFKVGFLDEVFRIRPMKPVVTRFPPEPNVRLLPPPPLYGACF